MHQILTLSNLLSLSRIIAAPITVGLVLQGRSYILLALCLFTVAAITDFFDGYFARKFNTATKLGAFLDPLADKILILSILFSFYWIGTIQLWVIFLIALRDIVITFLRIHIIGQGRILVTSALAKWKTLIQFFVIYLLFLSIESKKISTFLPIPIMMYTIVGFTLWTGISYLFVNRKAILANFS